MAQRGTAKRGGARKPVGSPRPSEGEGSGQGSGEKPERRPGARAEKPAKGDKRPRKPAAAGAGGGPPKRAAGAAPETVSHRVRHKWEEFLRFLKSVRVEVKRITWPSPAELRAATLIVLLTLAVVAGYIGIVNKIFSLIFQDELKFM
ncbi:MAG TPA: preprotein translocase subunit SecE [Candidatus Nitrosotenuis sp.]|jgi:preprotein translocase subunit SecE|nr:preprotein translocase subunit SecE [Candidatus Nitrosotenuis sp.]